MLVFLVYFIETLSPAFDTIGTIAGFVAVVSAIFWMVLRGIACDPAAEATESDIASINKIYKFSVWLICIWVATLFVPNKESSYKIAAAYGVQVVAESVAANPEIQKAAANSLRLLNQTIEGYMKQDEPEQKDEPEKKTDNT